jgi:hypothetical protein
MSSQYQEATVRGNNPLASGGFTSRLLGTEIEWATESEAVRRTLFRAMLQREAGDRGGGN